MRIISLADFRMEWGKTKKKKYCHLPAESGKG